jgi:lysyl-tRNA synthetase class 2
MSGCTILILAGFASPFPGEPGRYHAVPVSISSPWWDSEIYADRRPFLLARSRIMNALREWFRRRGFLEVETPILQASPGNEIHLHALATETVAPDGGRTRLYLHTSPEFACKKLLAAGEPKVFTFARVFRNRERGPLHHPEFTMLEWYRTNEPYEALMEDSAALMAETAKAAGSTQFRYKMRTADPFAAPARLSVAEAFARFAGVDLLATLPSGKPDAEKLAAIARKAGIQAAIDDSWSDLFSRMLVERVEPHLGDGQATLLYDYPIPEAALARPAADPRLAQRVELYACGVELANGFGELTDPAEQRRRFEHAMAEKERIYGERYPIDADFLAALPRMPPASGMALGFDRLVMLATGAERIEQVLWAPVAIS